MEKITNDIYYAGVNDHDIDLFEGQYIVPLGMAYNSYVVVDEKIAVFDSVGGDFAGEWLGKIEEACAGRTPDYLIIQHMEPDHSANLHLFMEKYPGAQIVASAKAWPLMKAFNGSDYKDRSITVAEGSTLELGSRTLHFITAPMVHWPEVIMTYDDKAKALFSADAFGKFGALDTVDPEGWLCEARRYYFGIVGKYGMQVQQVLKKAAALDIAVICSLHGPVLSEDIGYYLDIYNTWSSYGVENEGIAIFYSTVYGHTREAAQKLREKLLAKGCPKVPVIDLAREDWAENVEDAFRYAKIVLATTTYCNEIYPVMKQFIDHLLERGYQNRTIAFIENGSWAPTAAKKMKEMFAPAKNITLIDDVVTVRSALTPENEAQLDAMADTLMA